MRRLAVALGVCACTADGTGRVAEPIYGGSVDTGDANVVAVLIGPYLCSGTVVGKRTVLTAGHCVQKAVDSDMVDGFIYYGNDLRNDTENQIPLVGARYHRDFNYDPTMSDPATTDVAVVYVAEDIPLTPVVLNDSPLELHPVMPLERLRGVGWGLDEDGHFGTRRQAQIEFITLWRDDEFSAGNPFAGVCSGDSGGPMFFTIDGAERQIGITSWGPTQCDRFDAYFARVDVYLHSFILPAIDAFEGPCKVDGICTTAGCRTPDPDCDGCSFDPGEVCTPSCAIPDQDCPRGKGVGEACATAFDCESRICAEEPDEPGVKYCSRECYPGKSSMLCVNGTTCRASSEGLDRCLHPSLTPPEPDDGGGCSTTGGAGGPWGLLLVGALLRLSRRRR